MIMAGCTDGSASDSGDSAPVPALWPTTSDGIAVLRQADELWVTDGAGTAPLGIPAGAGAPVSAAAVAPDRLALLVTGQSPVLWVVDLRDGATRQRVCVDCRGLGSVDEQLVTVLGDGTLVILDDRLEAASTVPLADVVPPRTGGWEPEPGWSPDFTVLGSADDAVIVGRLAPDGGARGGPTLVSRHRLDGTRLEETSLEGRATRAEAESSGEHVVVDADHSSGACSSGSLLQTLDGHALRTEESEIIEDWSWAGDTVVAVTYSNQMTRGGACDYQSLTIHEFTTQGAETASVVSPGLTRVRVLGSCERVLGLRALEGELPWVDVTEGRSRTRLGQFDDIIWSAPATGGCSDLEAVVGALADA
jgi:hypothetical protein